MSAPVRPGEPSGPGDGGIRVTMVSPFPERDDTVRGGVEGVARTLTTALADTGQASVHVVAPARRDAEEVVGGVPVTRVRRSSLPGTVDYWTVLRRRLGRAIAASRPDITHFQGFTGWTFGFAAPHIVTIHGVVERDVLYTERPLPRLRSRLLGAVETRGRRRAPAIIVINPYVEEEMGGGMLGRRWQIENPVAPAFFSIRREPGPVVLFAGRVIPRKNVTALIEAFAAAASDVVDGELRIAGPLEDRGYAERCRRLAGDLGIGERVRFLGELGPAGLAGELAKAGCLAMTSHQETAPLVIGEAMAAGVPVVSYDVGGVRHMVSDGETGFLTPGGDVAGFGRRLSALLTDRDLMGRLGDAGRVAAL